MSKIYEAPALTVVGTVHDMTLQALDKVGTTSDFLTDLLPALDGKIVPDTTP